MIKNDWGFLLVLVEVVLSYSLIPGAGRNFEDGGWSYTLLSNAKRGWI